MGFHMVFHLVSNGVAVRVVVDAWTLGEDVLNDALGLVVWEDSLGTWRTWRVFHEGKLADVLMYQKSPRRLQRCFVQL